MGILDRPGLKEIEIVDCGEAIKVLDGREFFLEPMYFKWGHSDSPEITLRSGVIERLGQAQNDLRKIPGCGRWGLKIWDGFRSLQTQQSIYQAYWQVLREQNPSWTEESLRQAIEIFVSPARKDPSCPPPHNTGGAVDLTLMNEYGQEVIMGTEFDEFNVRAYTDHFDRGEDDISSFRNVVSQFPRELCLMFRRNRALLKRLLEGAGFVNYRQEWWHFSYGDQAWAIEKGEERAIYAGVERVLAAA